MNMYLDNNALIGSIPSGIGSLIDLAYLDLSDNKLSGAIPSQVGSLLNLVFLDMKNNQFSGAIPLNVGNPTSPTLSIDLSNNLLINTVPLSIAQVGVDASFCNFNGNKLCIPNMFDYQSIGKKPICGLLLPGACVTAIRNDNTVTAPEECDDGDTTSGDGWSQTCTIEKSRTVPGNLRCVKKHSTGPCFCRQW